MGAQTSHTSQDALLREITELRHQLQEATDTIEAIRTGQIDALIVERGDEHEIYTLKSADHTYRVFVENMTEGALTLNNNIEILYSNSRFASMVARPLANVIGEPFIKFVEDGSKATFAELVKTGWHTDCKGEILLRIDNDGTVPVQLSITTLSLENGMSLSVIVTDLSMQKATQKQLEDNNKELEASNHDLQQFASVASHDLQEPLRKIQIFSNLIKDMQGELSPELVSYLNKIIDSSAKMRTLIVDILDYSRLSANETGYQEVDLNEVVNDVKLDFDLLVQEKQATITSCHLPVIKGNKGQLRQVFQNIISNALKFSKPGVAPQINITCKLIAEKSFDAAEVHDGPFCLISIKDNGIGFNQKYMGNIFALFERLNTKNAYSGTGIGLAIAKKIVDKHKGLITAISKEGEGAAFMIILPL